jgi:hypothetical protein
MATDALSAAFDTQEEVGTGRLTYLNALCMPKLVIQVKTQRMSAYCRLRPQNDNISQAAGESGTRHHLAESKIWRTGNMKQLMATVGMVLKQETRSGVRTCVKFFSPTIPRIIPRYDRYLAYQRLAAEICSTVFQGRKKYSESHE